jgi:hypothetical protein
MWKKICLFLMASLVTTTVMAEADPGIRPKKEFTFTFTRPWEGYCSMASFPKKIVAKMYYSYDFNNIRGAAYVLGINDDAIAYVLYPLGLHDYYVFRTDLSAPVKFRQGPDEYYNFGAMLLEIDKDGTRSGTITLRDGDKQCVLMTNNYNPNK